MRRVLLLAACCSLFFALSTASQAATSATLIWSDEMTGTAGDNLDAAKWNTPALGTLTSDGTAILGSSSGTATILQTVPYNSTYSIQFRFRFLSASPATITGAVGTLPWGTEGFRDYPASLGLAWGNGWSEEDWFFHMNGTPTGSSSDWQTATYVAGPGVERVYVNDQLEGLYRATMGANQTWGLSFGVSQTSEIEIDYVRVYQGDYYSWPQNLVFQDDFGTGATTAEPAGKTITTLNKEWYAASNAGTRTGGYCAHTFSGYGQIVLKAARGVSNLCSVDLSKTRTLDFYTRFPSVTGGSQFYFGITNAKGASTAPRYEVYKLSGHLAYHIKSTTTAGELNPLPDISGYFTGDSTTDFQHFRWVIGPVDQRFYINDQLVSARTDTLVSTDYIVPSLCGADAVIANNPQTDKIQVWSSDLTVPNEVSADRWEMMQ